jgi:hypothetical protein
MILTAFFVNGFHVRWNTISSGFIWLVSKWLQYCPGAFAVDKTGVPIPVFGILGMVRRLVIRPGAIGDFIVSLPALESLRAGYLEVWAPAPNVPLVRFADRVRAIGSTGLDLLGVTDPPAGLLDQLRQFDSIVSWYGANRPEFRQLIRALDLPCRFFPALPPEAAAVHASDFYLDQVRALCPSTLDAIPRIPCRAEREDFAVIHPFSGSPRKNWPLEKFRQVARGLERHMPVQWCAGPDDPPLAGAVRIDNLYELARWLAGAHLYIGNDSGITHLAAAAGTPVLALFGPTDPAVWAPRGPNVRVVRWKP